MPASKNKKTPVKSQTTTRAKKPVKQVKRRLFVFAHHRHTFKLMPKHHTSYPMLGMVVLFVAIFCSVWTGYVSGDTNGGAYQVTAVVPAQPLRGNTIILYPADGDTVSQKLITMHGTCPANSYITLERAGRTVGVGLCQLDLTWSIKTTLTVGTNTLKVQSYNVTDSPGTPTKAITVAYSVPGLASALSTTTITRTAAGAVAAATPKLSAEARIAKAEAKAKKKLILWSNYTYGAGAVASGQTYTKTVSMDGGNGPYAVNIEWGDGSSSLMSYSSLQSLDLNHIYAQHGGYKNSYNVTVTATDSTGDTTDMQLVALITPKKGETVTTTKKSSGFPQFAAFWRLALPTFGFTFVALFSFWLGQHRELETLHREAVRMHRRRPA